MSNVSINGNTIYWTILRGTSAQIPLTKSDGWAMYDEIIMDFKLKKDLKYPSELRLTVGEGIIIDGTHLIVSLSYEQTGEFRVRNMFADIKLRIGNIVIPPIPFAITITDTVTEVPS
jgi:hypothetical protein